ncbi:3-oxoacyl-(acyl-carrier-protein) reductase FabG [Mariniflexile rhizosphaerae]|uniref:SDR family oxidoreductase n=1 Tax=unclassified Mariniflexile TaxID=2643887 RepID=UPI000CA961E8|nr:SDR family oxidoreductase [Mariniflexile sp. TRM1-10]AXP80028.1 3-oxoacyl-(acyl-carrier-protein) reductase FabG [Mariniflexile sp. TRM1-10]PLB20966.1 MAG: Short chain dehydrogenase [Flavobacteriaceae bacterium FS1-H7996/R]
MDLHLKDKVVVVTGAAGIKGSIGETIVQSLANEGAIPVIVCRNDRGYGYEKELHERGIDALFVKTDLTQPDQIEAAVKAIAEKYGRIDALINNVGVNDGVGLDASIDDFMWSLKLNLVSFFVMTKYCLPYIKKSKGNILNIGSKVGMTGQGGTSGYAASKGGVLGLTREWAVDLIKDKIRVNALIISESWTPAYDNWIKTLDNGEEKLKAIVKKIPLENRMTTPEEIADACLFTISDRSSHTTGQYIIVDGGYVHLDRSLLTE